MVSPAIPKSLDYPLNESSLKTVRLDVPHVTGKRGKETLSFFSNKGGTTIFVLLEVVVLIC